MLSFTPEQEDLPMNVEPAPAGKSIAHSELKCFSSRKSVGISSEYAYYTRSCTSFYDIKGYGPPFVTFGSPGDIYFDLTPQPFIVYVRTQNEWVPWNWTDRDPKKLSFAMATHPILASRYLYCTKTSRGLNWYSPDSLRGHPLPGQEFNPQDMLAAILGQYQSIAEVSFENTTRMHLEHHRRQILNSATWTNAPKRRRSPTLDLTGPEPKVARKSANVSFIDLSGIPDDEGVSAKNIERNATSACINREREHQHKEKSIRRLKQTISDLENNIYVLQANLAAAESSRQAALKLCESMEQLYKGKKEELEHFKNQYMPQGPLKDKDLNLNRAA